jgi:ethanolamine ammonia-lyase small subunit
MAHGPGEEKNAKNDSLDSTLSELVQKLRAQTPARLLAGRSGAAYRTSTQMQLREAHAAARDAVRTELNLMADFDEDLIRNWNLFEICSQASSKDEYLLRPDFGRRLTDDSRAELSRRCIIKSDLQILIGDGLSVTAVKAQLSRLLPLLFEGAQRKGWKVGAIPVVRYCRVGILNEIGNLLRPTVAVLLIGERPGLATDESLSAYMAYQPKPSDTDAHRNLISNIDARGVSPELAAERILNLAALMIKNRQSGYQLREHLPDSGGLPA